MKFCLSFSRNDTQKSPSRPVLHLPRRPLQHPLRTLINPSLRNNPVYKIRNPILAIPRLSKLNQHIHNPTPPTSPSLTSLLNGLSLLPGGSTPTANPSI
jgi:hypothetical protein